MTAHQYHVSFIGEALTEKSIIGAIKRPDGRIMTSAMLGSLSSPERPLAKLGDFLDIAMATLASDGEVTLSFPDIVKE